MFNIKVVIYCIQLFKKIKAFLSRIFQVFPASIAGPGKKKKKKKKQKSRLH